MMRTDHRLQAYGDICVEEGYLSGNKLLERSFIAFFLSTVVD